MVGVVGGCGVTSVVVGRVGSVVVGRVGSGVDDRSVDAVAGGVGGCVTGGFTARNRGVTHRGVSRQDKWVICCHAVSFTDAAVVYCCCIVNDVIFVTLHVCAADCLPAFLTSGLGINQSLIIATINHGVIIAVIN